MAQVINILGASGSGKSTSIKNLNPEETFIINVLGKRLPFKGSNGLYNEEKKNKYNAGDYNTVIKYLAAVSERRPEIKTIVVDDFLYLMRKDAATAMNAKGDKYQAYNVIALNMKAFYDTCVSLRDDLHIYLMCHISNVTSDDSVKSYEVATFGKLTDRLCKPEEIVETQLFCQPRKTDEGIEYGFYTRRVFNNGIELPAKTPDGMFEEEFIPNDLALVNQAIDEYYA